MLEIKRIESETTYPLRHKILRPHRPYEECIYDTDNEPESFHIGAFYKNEVISVASFCIEACPGLPSKRPFRLRAMATWTEFREMGAGRAVVNYAEDILKSEKVDLLWCKGRVNVQKYYEKLGFKRYGDVFDYPSIGPHIIMYKKLT